MLPRQRERYRHAGKRAPVGQLVAATAARSRPAAVSRPRGRTAGCIAWHGRTGRSGTLAAGPVPDRRAPRVPHRESSGIQVRVPSPMYSLSGLISRLSACCSMTCAVQPAILEMEKTGVKRSVGMHR